MAIKKHKDPEKMITVSIEQWFDQLGPVYSKEQTSLVIDMERG